MNSVNFHLAYLLSKHDRVIIPDFGAFVISPKKDSMPRRNFIPQPVNYSLTFDPQIICDDGLLVGSIAKEKGIGNGEALRLVHEYVDGLVEMLRGGQAVNFPCIGTIHLSSDRKIVFTPAKNLSCNAASCGLVHLSFPCLNEVEERILAKKRKKIYRRPVFYIVLSAVVLLLILLAVIGKHLWISAIQ
ncbi:MAG: hypothetical protein LBE71_05405 [Dysgonamonadaceae bacterium]|jgi:nucleoid DNA-binding protein|nr:hypothetical protein [Dysgonamonadaceae bacterium]